MTQTPKEFAMPTELPEFAQITELMAQAGGEARGLVSGVAALQTHLTALAARVERVLQQTDAVTRQAVALHERARRDLALLTADRDAQRDEMAKLRAAAGVVGLR